MRIRVEHQEAYLEMCEIHPELITQKFNGPDGKSRGNVLWQKMTEKLNSLGYGSKSKDEWRKAFTDWRCKTKSKANKIITSAGAPSTSLSVLERRLLDLMNFKYVNEELGVSEFQEVKIEPQEDISILQVETVPQEETKPEINEHEYCYRRKTYETNFAEASDCSSNSSFLSNRSRNLKKVGHNRTAHMQSKILSRRLKENNELLKEMKDDIKSMANSLRIIAEALSSKTD